MLKINQVAGVVASEVFKDLGLSVDLGPASIADLANYRSLGKFKINPSMCGPIGIMFSSIDVEVHVGAYQRDDQPLVVCFQYEFSYNHPDGGSNGKTIRKEVTIN